MIDSHCHLNFKAFRNDWHEVAERAFSGGVNAIINVGSNIETSQRAIELASTFPLPEGESRGLGGGLYAAIGLHPVHVADGSLSIVEFESLLCHPDLEQRAEACPTESFKRGSLSTYDFLPSCLDSRLLVDARRATFNSRVVALGETGIDLFHSPDNLEVQRDAFVQFIDLANKYSLPVIIHNRNAGTEVLKILMAHRPLHGGVMHFFSEDWDYAQKLFDLGLLISFTGAITLDNIDNKTIEVIKKAPLDKIMIETDAPYVVPEPMKSQGIKRNEPLFISEAAKKIAEVKNISFDGVTSQTTKNTINLFKLPPRP